MTKLQEASFNLDAVKDQIANAIEASALNDPARVRKEFG
jgi:hypothetical protein